LIRALIVPFFLLALLASLGDAQESHSPNSATASGMATPVSTQNAAPAAERVVLKVGDAQVTQADFESRIRDLEPQGDAEREGAKEQDKDRRRLGDDYASVLMLSQQAVADHLDSSPEVIRQLLIARLQVLSDAEFANLMSQAKPTTEEIDKYYSAHLSDYDRVDIRRLFIWKQRDNAKDAPVLSSQAARAAADRIRQAYSAGTSEQKLADDLRKSGEGMFDPQPLTFPRGELSGQMEKVAFALKAGEWSEVQDTAASLLLIQLVKRDRQPLKEVSSTIENELQGKNMEARLVELKKKAGIWMDEQYFGTAVAPVRGAKRSVSNPPSELRKSAKKGESDNDERQK
jgi:hypothetical protein